MRFTSAALAAVSDGEWRCVRAGCGAARGHRSAAAGTPAPTGPAPGTAVPVVPAARRAAAAARNQNVHRSAGLIFNTVRPDRVVDFEMVMGYLQAAFEKSTDQRVHEQAKGWRVFKVTEPGPNSSVMYVFVIDPADTGSGLRTRTHPGRRLSGSDSGDLEAVYRVRWPRRKLLNYAVTADADAAGASSNATPLSA